MTSTQTVLAFDFGVRRIGVAVGQTLTRTATALEILPTENTTLLWSSIDRLMRDWQPGLIVLGKPLHADDSETPLFELIKDFGNQLQARYNCLVQYIDERLSSSAAFDLSDIESDSRPGRQAKKSGRPGKKNASAKHIDHIAAKLILESWFRETL